MDSKNNPLDQNNATTPVEQIVPVEPATPTPAPTPELASEPVAEPTSASVSTPAPTPTSDPAPESTPSTPAAPAKKKLSGGAIAGIVIGALATIAVTILGILSTLGIIDWSSLMGSISIPGISATPTAALAKSTCERHNGTITAISEDNLSSSAVSFTEGYYCKYNGSYDDQDAFEFAIYFINGNMVDYFHTTGGNLPASYTVLENSDDMIKFYNCSSSSNYCSYEALYKNAAVEMISTNIATAEQALVELGLPNRSKAN